MPFGVFKAALLGSGAGGAASYIGLLTQTATNRTFRHHDHDVDSSGNVYALGTDNSKQPYVIKLDYDASGLSVGASSGAWSGSGNTMTAPRGTVVVRDDNKIAVGWNQGNKTFYYYRLGTNLAFDSGNLNDHSVEFGNFGGHGYAGKGKCLATKSNVEYGCWVDYFGAYGWIGSNSVIWDDSNTYVDAWVQNASNPGEIANMVMVDDDSTQYYVCCTDAGQSKATVVALNVDGTGGAENFPITGSSHQYWSATYNVDPPNSGSAGYFAATMRAPNSSLGIVIGKATSADTPNSFAWSRKYVSTGSYVDIGAGISNIVTDSSGNVYVAWKQRILSGTPGYPTIVASWQSDGTHRWSRILYSLGSSSYETTTTSDTPGLSITPDDNLIVTTEAGFTQTGGTNREGYLVACVLNDGSLESTSAHAITGSGITTCNAYWSAVPSGWNFAESAGGLTTGSESDTWVSTSSTPASLNGTLTTTYTGAYAQSGDL